MARKSGESRLGRLARLGGLTSKVTRSYIGNRVKNALVSEEVRKKARHKLHIDNAKQIVETVSRMKGAAMKLGQQMAVMAQSLDLPEEVGATLSKLHKDSEPIPWDIIKEDVEAELEGPISDHFASFDERPLGTASLGQAHVATLLDGTEVVVKVLHRGVEHSVDTDMMALKAVLLSGRVLRRDKAEIEAAFDEIQARLREELDYLQEAVNIHTFGEMFAGDDRVRIPKIHAALCTERILTMDRLPGVHLDQFLKSGSPEAKQRAGVTLAEIYYEMVFRHRTLHADPHPGNYLFEEDGRVGLVDFGCIKRFNEFWIGTYATAALATHHGDRATALEAARELGSWEGTNPEEGDLLWEFCEVLGNGFRLGEITLGQHQEQFMEDMKPVIKKFIRNPNVKIPKDVLFMHRSLGGLYSIARQLGCRADFGAIMSSHAQYAVDKAQGRVRQES